MDSLQQIKRFREELRHIDVVDFVRNRKEKKKGRKKRLSTYNRGCGM